MIPILQRGFMMVVTIALLAGCDAGPAENFFYEPRSLSQIVDDLVEAGQNVNDYDIDGNSLLVVAIREDEYAVFRRLLDAGADPGQVRFSDELSAFRSLGHYARSLPWGERYTAALAADGSSAPSIQNAAQSGWVPPLIRAVRSNDFAAVTALLESGANIEDTDPNGVTALHSAVVIAKYRMAVCLVSSGASLHSEDDYGETPMSTFLRFHADREFRGSNVFEVRGRRRWHTVLTNLVHSGTPNQTSIPAGACDP